MRAETETARLDAAARALTQLDLAGVGIALVLGSGLRGFVARLADAVEVPFHDVPHWPVPRVEGHGASLVVGVAAGVRVACLTGRVHLYEGWQANEVVRPVRTLRRAGVPRFVLSNAAGGIGEDLVAGDLMVLTDHLNLTGRSALCGAHEPELGPRFPDQSAVYDATWRAQIRALDPAVRAGVYAGLLGPSYETPAEVRMLRQLGADAVGMSTVLEATALSAMGAQVAGISLISNLAAGISDRPLSHDEVIAAGTAAAARFSELLFGLCGSAGTRDHE
ncbi:MAG: purine-nucleoside phosphorylase [Planctomycetes bacterium]|nr:purine-nucleoside phosphorylase [Planctomycetota bacterium]MCB9869755.1 purine-nucleoside phosphorylase [Planctomycetota bacterium]